ncbi:hypothetical protein J0H58_33460 [bacterium]|nr:hypothetical protein [bacterium]
MSKSKEFDVSLKTLVDGHIAEWVAFLAARAGLPPGPARPIDTDLSASLHADRLIRVDAPKPFALHLEFQSSSELGLPARMLCYNVLAERANKVPVLSVLILVRPGAAASDQTGVWEVSAGDGPPHLTFRYAVVRVWQEAMDTFLNAGPGLAPLAVLTDEAAGNLEAAFRRFDQRLKQPDVPANVAEAVSGLTLVLSGMRYDEDMIRAIYGRLDMTLEDSTTYQWILKKGRAEGRAEEARNLVLRAGTRKFGAPPTAAVAALDSVADRERLERMLLAAFDAAGWDDLLATP